MVDKLKEIINKILEEKNGQLTVFAMLKMDELTDKWSIIVSAPWANLKNHGESFDYIKNLLDQKLTSEEKITIARIGIFPKDDHAVTALLQFNNDTVIREDTKINGFTVHEGYILYSNPQI